MINTMHGKRFRVSASVSGMEMRSGVEPVDWPNIHPICGTQEPILKKCLVPAVSA